MTVRPIVAWYDIWIGVFVDTAKRRVYILPLPCIGIIVEWAANPEASRPCTCTGSCKGAEGLGDGWHCSLKGKP